MIPEHKEILNLLVTDPSEIQEVEHWSGRLQVQTCVAGINIPADTKVMLKIAQRHMGKDGCEINSIKVAIGIPWTIAEFTHKAISCDHPMAGQAKTSDQLKVTVASLPIKGAEAWRNHFTETVSQWKDWVRASSVKEETLHSALNPRVEDIVTGKNLLAF